MAEYVKCETCLYNKNCQFLASHKNAIVEGCTAYKNAEDVVEVVHGEWIFNRGQAYGEPLYFCSVCTDGGSEWGKDKYCPNCGAKMDGKGN